MRVNVVDVAEDVTTASQKRWNLWDKRWTNAALADRTNTPQNLGLSVSDYRLEQELRSHVPRSPMDSNASPQPSLGSTDPDNSHPLPVDPPQPAHNNLPLNIDLNVLPKPSQEPTDGPDAGSHSTDSPMHSGSLHSTDSMPVSPLPGYDAETQVFSKSPSSSPSFDSNPPPQHGDFDIFYNRPLSDPVTLSDPGPPRPYSPTDSGLPLSDQGPLRRPDSPSDSEESTGTYFPSDSEESTRVHPSSSPGLSTPHPPPSPEPLEHDSEDHFSDLFRGGRLKRRVSGSRSVNAARRELQDTLDSREYVSASASPLPPTFQFPWS